MNFLERVPRILVLNGPNLNLLGEREPEFYGTQTLAQLNAHLRKSSQRVHGRIRWRFFQRNGEGELIDLLHRWRFWASGVLFNPGAYTHTSYALRDAVAALSCPVVEVHLSDLKKRALAEPFRGISVIAPVCAAQYMGEGVGSYERGVSFLIEAWERQGQS